MRKVAIGLIAFAVLVGIADTALKAAPMSTPPGWTGFYIGGEAGGGWSHETVASSPNDFLTTLLLNGNFAFTGQQAVVSPFALNQSGAVGGLEAGYNWQLGTNWLAGVEADFSLSGLGGQGSGTSVLQGPPNTPFTQSINAQTSTDWYGTVRGRLGWLATPNLLLFGTGGFAYGRVVNSANYTFNGASGVAFNETGLGISFSCTSNIACFSGSSSGIKTGWTAGAGAEWRLAQNWSAKIEYEFVDLGSDTVRVTAAAVAVPGNAPSTFNAVFRDQFQVVRLGLNYHF